MDHPTGYLDAWTLTIGNGHPMRELPEGAKFVHRDRDQRLGVLLEDDLDDAAEAALFVDDRVYAVAGGEPLIRWLLRDRLGAGVTTIALRDGNVDALVGASVLPRIRALCVRDAKARTPALARLLASSWSALRSLSIFDATPELIAALPETLLAQLHVLRIAGPVAVRVTRVDLSAILGADRRHLRELDLDHLALSSAEIEAFAAGDWSVLEELRIDGCEIADGGAALARARFGALRVLRSTAWHQRPRSLGDAAVAAIIATNRGLERAILTNSDAGNAAAISAATHGARLRALDLDGTRVGDAGALAIGRSNLLDGLESFHLNQNVSFDAAYALADSSSPAIRDDARREHRGVASLWSWRPTKPTPTADGTWPDATLPRRFRWQRIDVCPDCHGTGRTGDGSCGMHEATVIHPIEHGDAPPTETSRAWFVGIADHVVAVERHAAEMLTALAAWGRWPHAQQVTWCVHDWDHHLEYELFDAPKSVGTLITAAGRPEMSHTGVWAHACARAHARDHADLPDPFTPARRIADRGIRILGLDPDDGLLLLLDPRHHA